MIFFFVHLCEILQTFSKSKKKIPERTKWSLDAYAFTFLIFLFFCVKRICFFHQNEVKAKGLAAQFKVTLEEAQPTLGHMSLVQLCKTGLLQLVVSTNVDGI